MKTAGIIAEYNPFHNGHAYHIEETRQKTGADYVVVVMSGDFVQRGEPALLDKYTRARMALQNGADLVLELPTAYACSSAEIFSSGAVRTLQQLGVVDVLSFGCESGNDTLFDQLARLYLDEPEQFSADMKEAMKQGLTYPQARAAATERFLDVSVLSELNTAEASADSNAAQITSCSQNKIENGSTAAIQKILASPNNILAIEYRKACIKFCSDMQLLSILRKGDYHSTELPENDSRALLSSDMNSSESPSAYASASAIRALLSEKDILANAAAREALARQVPADVLAELLLRNDTIKADDFSAALGYALLASRNGDLTAYADITPDLSDRILKHLTAFAHWDDFTDLIKTRQMTRTRISRALLHLLLRIRSEQMAAWSNGGFAYYARVLGFRKESAVLLTAIKQKGFLPMLTKMADAKASLCDFYKDEPDRLREALGLLETDLFAADLYESVAAAQYGRERKNEYRHGVIILN